MANVFTLRRSTAQPTSLNTATVAVTDIGSPIPGMQITQLLPTRCANLFTVFGGDPYLLTLSAIGDIEIYRFAAGAWALVGGPFTPTVGHVLTPLCIHVVNEQMVALWSDEAGANDGIGSSVTTNGTVWSLPVVDLAAIGASNGGDSIVYRGAIWFATAIGLWAYAPLNRFITLTAPLVGAFLEGETVTGSITGTTAIVRSHNTPVLRVDTVSGSGFGPGDVISGALSLAFGTFGSKTRVVNAFPDTGNDVGLTGATGPSNLIGSFASWDGVLYFLQPKTAAGALKIYQLDSAWESGNNVPTPQWTFLTGTTGIVDAGLATVAADAGMWTLFVNKLDELCLFYSGANGTKLAKTSSKTLPLAFTDVTTSLLPLSVSTIAGADIRLYTDDRRRDNILQMFLIRDLAGGNLIVSSWDGSNSVEVTGTLAGADYILPASRFGQESTFTNLQPGCQMTGVNQPFPGRVRIDYLVRCDPARTVDVLPEYSLDGDQFFAMTKGDGDSGATGLAASPAGIPYFFHWDTFADLTGDLDNVLMRVVTRISGV